LPVTVALDGRGAERGAQAVIEGARAAAADDIRLRVFGDPDRLAAIQDLDGAELIPATEEITNADEPVAAVRSRQEASVVQAATDVADGRSAALVSAGSTGATMTAALFALRRMQGVRRPALALQLPVPGRGGRPLLLLDVGANTEARAVDLVQFAYLGSSFSAAVLGVERPRVGLLSVGEEQKKGSAEVVEANARLADASGIEFIGNLEGRDLMGQDADVVVTDGFTGNVVLKTIEGTAKGVADAVRAAARSGVRAALGGTLLRPALGSLRRQLDPDTTGGAILLGLRGSRWSRTGARGPMESPTPCGLRPAPSRSGRWSGRPIC
jgi:glycerol-3-phosphate acyltransferase PlsX